MPKLRVLVLINHPASSLVVVLTPPPTGHPLRFDKYNNDDGAVVDVAVGVT